MLKGGFHVGPDGRIHGTYSHNPSTLRLSMHDPNLQQIPRGGGVAKWVKECFVSGRDKSFWARDFSGIEAVLVGYFVGGDGGRSYVRLAKLDVHSFYTAYALNALDGRVHSSDLPLLSMDDTKLGACLAEIKAEFKEDRNNLYKHLVHGANFMQGPKGAADKILKETGHGYPVRQVAKLMDIYFELFPDIRKWHRDLCNRIDGTKRRKNDGSADFDAFSAGVCHVRNPFGYVHRFYNVLDWEKVETSPGISEWFSTLGVDAPRAIAFLPQGTASAIIKKAAKRIWYEHPLLGQDMRLLIHDEILGESDEQDVESALATSKAIMEAPIEELPLDPAWNMGEFLSIGTEAKFGKCWAEMKGVA